MHQPQHFATCYGTVKMALKLFCFQKVEKMTAIQTLQTSQTEMFTARGKWERPLHLDVLVVYFA